MTTLLNGLLGGLVVGALTAVATGLVGDGPSATTALAERALGGRGSRSRWGSFAARVLYGVLAGVAVVAVELYALRLVGVPPTVGEAFAVAFAGSAFLFVIAFIACRVVLSRATDRSYLGELLAYHLVFGVGFGVWIRLTWIT
jgi:hypothetical protein